MASNSFFAKFLRFIGIVSMALTGGFTLLGGIGTTCAALAPAKYDSMKALAPFQWLYILFVLLGIAIGVVGAIFIIAGIVAFAVGKAVARNFRLDGKWRIIRRSAGN